VRRRRRRFQRNLLAMEIRFVCSVVTNMPFIMSEAPAKRQCGGGKIGIYPLFPAHLTFI